MGGRQREIVQWADGYLICTARKLIGPTIGQLLVVAQRLVIVQWLDNYWLICLTNSRKILKIQN